jgi:hypothetical protein
MIAEAVKTHPNKNFETGSISFEGFRGRVKNQRIKNRKVSSLFVKRHYCGCVDSNDNQGPETWMASRGTEANPEL